MKVDGRHFRSIWLEDDGWTVGAIDRRRLPHEFVVARITRAEDATEAIRSMLVRGAPLIGATAAYGMALAMRTDASDAALDSAYAMLLAARPTAVNLRWALDEMARLLRPLPASERATAAYKRAVEIAEEDVAINQGIGRHGFALIEQIAATKRPGEPVNVLTHCNAGWLATVDWGTATAPIYLAHDRGLKVHVWVDETPPRNQGASLTALGLRHAGAAGDGLDHRTRPASPRACCTCERIPGAQQRTLTPATSVHRLHVQYRHRRRGSDRTGGGFACGDERSRGRRRRQPVAVRARAHTRLRQLADGSRLGIDRPQYGYFPFYLWANPAAAASAG